MRAVLFHARLRQSTKDWATFLRNAAALGPPPQAEEIAPGVWLLPLPACQTFLDGLTALLTGNPLPNAAARTLQVDYVGTWQTVS
jgi:hypothetical protein